VTLDTEVVRELIEAIGAMKGTLDDISGKVGLVSARATRIETRQARMLIHLGMTHDGNTPMSPPPNGGVTP
jgi:hypothetical protein